MSTTSIPSSTNNASNLIDLASGESENVYCYRSAEQLKIATIIAKTLSDSFGSCFPEVHNQYKKIMASSVADEFKSSKRRKA